MVLFSGQEVKKVNDQPIYISGPMSGRPALNFPAFAHAAAQLRAAGLSVCNPIELGSREDSWTDCMRRDLAALLTCRAVATLDGWRKSRGARLEVRVARALGLPVQPAAVWIADLYDARIASIRLQAIPDDPACLITGAALAKRSPLNATPVALGRLRFSSL